MNFDGFDCALLTWSRRLARPVAALLVAGLIAPFVLHPVLGPGADNVLGYVGIITIVFALIITIVFALIIGPCLVLPMGLVTDVFGTVDGSVVTVQTVRGARSVDVARLQALHTLYLYGRGTDSVFWWLRDAHGGLVVFRLRAGATAPVLAALRPAVIDHATAGHWRPSLRVRRELLLDESGSTYLLPRMIVTLLQYLCLVLCGCAVLAGYVGLYSLAGIATS